MSIACEVLEVSASGYFIWQRRRNTERPGPAGRHSDEALLAHMRVIHAEVKGEFSGLTHLYLGARYGPLPEATRADVEGSLKRLKAALRRGR